jgi:hypothetical protein
VNTHPANRPAAAHTTDRVTSDPAPLVPTSTTADHVTADHVTAREIADFLRHLAELRASARGDDPAERAAFLARKAELFTRLAADTPGTTVLEGRTP